MTTHEHEDRGAITGALAGASFVAGLAGAMRRSAHPYPRPGASGAEIRRYFTQPSRAPWISVAGQLASAACLARYTTSVAGLASRSPRRRRLLQATALAGGAVASATLAFSAASAARLAGRPGGDPDRDVVIARRAFLAGGPIHGVGLGALVGALGLAGLRTGELSPTLAWAAIGDAPLNVLGMLYLVAEPAGWFIPAGRFPGLIIAGISGVTLSRGTSDWLG
jgi:hypothetical protein